MYASLTAIEFHVPAGRLTNDEVAQLTHNWTTQKILDKTGIAERRLAAADECSSDLAFHAAEKLFAGGACQKQDIDYVLFCTQTPDYLLPTTACLLQDRLKLSSGIGRSTLTLVVLVTSTGWG